MPMVLESSQANITRVAQVLRGGGVVGFPTETVYGLGADTFNTRAIGLIYEIKGRPVDNPLIAHVIDGDGAARLTTHWDDRCQQLADRFWPGPLTLIVPRAVSVPAEASGGRDTIAVRSPRHPVARGLLQEFGGTISAPSANRSGHVSPTSAAHVAEDFADVGDLLILDGGSCEIGIESTVLDVTGETPTILRRGSISLEQLAEVLQRVDLAEAEQQSASPGTSLRHYAPRTPTTLIDAADVTALHSDKNVQPNSIAILASDETVNQLSTVPAIVWHRAMPVDDVAYAACLYDALRGADQANADAIWIEKPPDNSALWQAIRDRLKRATQVGTYMYAPTNRDCG